MNRGGAQLLNGPRGRVSRRPVRTTLMLELSEGEAGKPRLILRGSFYNRDLARKMLRMALESIDAPAQHDAGPGGQRIVIPASANLVDLYEHGRKKI